MIDPLVSRAIAAGLGLLLLSSAWHKVSARAQFAAALDDYRLLPAAWVGAATRLLPAIEGTLGLAWLAEVERGATAFATAALLGLYAAAIAINLRRGRVHIGCGCGLGGASGRDQPLSWWLVARNLVLVAVAALAAVPATHRELGPYDWLTLALVLAACAALFAGASQLLRNGSAIASWSKARD